MEENNKNKDVNGGRRGGHEHRFAIQKIREALNFLGYKDEIKESYLINLGGKRMSEIDIVAVPQIQDIEHVRAIAVEVGNVPAMKLYKLTE